MSQTGGEWELVSLEPSQNYEFVARCRFKKDSETLIIDVGLADGKRGECIDRSGRKDTYHAWMIDNKGAAHYVTQGSKYARELGIPQLIEQYEPVANLMKS